MGAKHSRPMSTALVMACVTQLPGESHAFTPLLTKPVVTKQSGRFLYLGDDGESVPLTNGVNNNKLKQPDLIIPPSSLGMDEAWAAMVNLEMEMNMSDLEEDFEDEHEDVPVSNESLHRSLLEARLRMEKRAVEDSITSKPLVNSDNDIRAKKSLDSVRMQLEATAQTLDSALADIDDGTSFEPSKVSKESSAADKETETAFKREKMSQVGFKKSIQPTDARIYRSFLSLKEKRLEEALRAAEDYELMAAEALRKAQEEEKIRLVRLALIQKLTVDAVRQAEEERQLLAAKKSEALHRSLLETRNEMESNQKSLRTATDTVATSSLDSRPTTTNGIAVDAPAFISRRQKAKSTFLFHRALLETQLEMESKAKEPTVMPETSSPMSKHDATLPYFATEVTTSNREIPNGIRGAGKTNGQDSQSRQQYYFIDEIPSHVEKGDPYPSDSVETCTGAQKQEFRGVDKTFSLPSFFGEALDTVGNALDSMDTTFAEWIESRSNPKSAISRTNSAEESHQLSVNKVDRAGEFRTGKPPASPRPTFVLKGAKSVDRLPYVPKVVPSESTVHTSRNDNSIATASIKRPNETEESTHPSTELDEKQPSQDDTIGRPTFVLRKGKGAPGPQKDEGEPQVQHKSALTPTTLSYRERASLINTTSSLNAHATETNIMERKEQEDAAIIGNAVSHLAKSAFNGGKAAFFTFGAVLEVASSEGVVSSAKAASSRVAAAFESISNTFTNSTNNADEIIGIAIEDGSSNGDVASQIAAAASSVADVGRAFVRGMNSSPFSHEAFDAARESTKECVSFLGSVTAFGIKQGKRALHRFEMEEDGTVSEPFILEQQISLGDISLSTVNIPNAISKCRIGNGASKNAEPTIDYSTKTHGENVAKKRLEVINFQNMQEEIYSSKADENSAETRKLFRSIFHS